jgi:hypothetical protein
MNKPVPQEHQVVYTTLHFEQPWLMDNYLKVDGYQALRRRSSPKSPTRQRSSTSSRTARCAGVVVPDSRPA